MRRRLGTVALGVGLAAGVATCASAQATSPEGAVVVRVLVLNRANVRPEMIAAAEQDADAIYAAAGVQIAWLNAGPAGLAGDPPLDMTVMLVSGASTRIMSAALDDRTLGFASSNSASDAERGRMAWAFCDRVEETAARYGLAVARLLGKAVAHEIGHLLLPYNSHSAEGIMRATWDLRSGRLEYFTRTQAGVIGQRLIK